MSFLLPACVKHNELQTDGLFKDHMICAEINIQITVELFQGNRYNCRHVKTIQSVQRLGQEESALLKVLEMQRKS